MFPIIYDLIYLNPIYGLIALEVATVLIELPTLVVVNHFLIKKGRRWKLLELVIATIAMNVVSLVIGWAFLGLSSVPL